MAAEQLTLLDLAPEVTGPRSARPRARRAGPAKPAIAARSDARSAEPVAGEMVIEHRYPQALEFLREHGPDAVAVLHVLVAQAEPVEGRLVVAASETRPAAATSPPHSIAGSRRSKTANAMPAPVRTNAKAAVDWMTGSR